MARTASTTMEACWGLSGLPKLIKTGKYLILNYLGMSVVLVVVQVFCLSLGMSQLFLIGAVCPVA